MSRLVINGDTREFGPADFPATLSALVTCLGLDPAMVVAEVNGEIIRREAFAARAPADGDVIELVRFVGGG